MNSRIHLHPTSWRRTRRLVAFLCGLLLLPLPIRDVARGASQASRREALEWLLEAGGDAVIREKGMHPKPVTRGQRLPRRPFDVQRIVVEKWLRPVRPEELQCLAALDETESLALYHLPAGCGLGFLRDWRGLENLSLYYADFGDDVLGDLEGLSSLKELLIRYNRNFTGSGLERLAGLKNLEALDLELTGLTEETRPVFTAFPRLQTLSLSKNRVGEAAAEEAARLVFLRRLNLSGASLIGEALRALSRNPRLEAPAMDVDSAEAISAARALDFLSLRGKGFGEAHFRAISMPYLEALVVYGPSISGLPFIDPRQLKHLKAIKIREGTMSFDQRRQLQSRFPAVDIRQ